MARKQSARHTLNEIAKSNATTSDDAAVRARAQAEVGNDALKTKISEDGRRLLREAVIAQGYPSDLGNRLADWLDAHDNAKVSIEGKSEQPALVVYSSPDIPPKIKERAPFTPNEE